MAEAGGGADVVTDMAADKPHVPLDVSKHEFVTPKKEISRANEIAEKWEKSEAYQDLVGFIVAMNDAVKNVKLRDQFHVAQIITNLMEMIATLSRWIDEIQPIDQPQRFGNKAFRTWFEKLKENVETLLKEALEEKFHPAIPEMAVYLVESVGNSTRIDYGTGHEMAFVAFLCCLYKIGALTEEDAKATVCLVFNSYIVMVRKLQLAYRMEPAGSQGVWSLDDYQFVVFIWGSAQLLDHKRIKPKSFTNEEIVEGFHKDYMFLGQIQYILQVKTGPFAEHSNQLWNISGVPLWSKVNQGLIKMYKAEVLNKFPVIQHFLFGSLMSINPATSPS